MTLPSEWVRMGVDRQVETMLTNCIPSSIVEAAQKLINYDLDIKILHYELRDITAGQRLYIFCYIKNLPTHDISIDRLNPDNRDFFDQQLDKSFEQHLRLTNLETTD